MAADVHGSLAAAGHQVDRHGLELPQAEELLGRDLVIAQSGPDHTAAALCRELRDKLKDRCLPVLVLTDASDSASRARALEAGADAALAYPCSRGELLVQVQSLVRLKRLYDRLYRKHEGFVQVNQRLQQAYEQMDQELRLARRLQQSLLPQTLPQIPPARFAVHYRPCGQVGGDFYDVFRLDEDHVGFYVADVVGHGLPASLLTVFLKKTVRPKEITGQRYRLLAPDTVLQQLNRELIAQELAEKPFITMVYGLFNRRSLTLAFARAGHPYPLYIPRRGDLRFWNVHGALLGVFETQFLTQSHVLRPGDKLLFYTDGMENSSGEDEPGGTERLLELAGRHRELDVEALVQKLARELSAQAGKPDDFTLLGLEVGRS
jgi:phosphoserine phosphatase RsbU/P